MAEHRRQGLRLHRSDRRRRCRGEGGNLQAVRRRAQERRGNPDRFYRFRGSRQGLSPRPRVRPRPGCGRTRSIRSRRSRTCSPPRPPASRRPRRAPSLGADMQTIRSNAIEPTRSDLAGLTRREAILRQLPVYGLPILTVLLIVGFSIALPDTFPTYAQLPLDPQRQGDHRAPVARLDAADDGRSRRSHGGLRHRALAHPGDRPASFNSASRGRSPA